VHHSDRGTQYLSIRYTERLAEAGIEPSVGSRGDSYDNALAESVIGLFKTEVIRRRGPWLQQRWRHSRNQVSGGIGAVQVVDSILFISVEAFQRLRAGRPRDQFYEYLHTEHDALPGEKPPFNELARRRDR
jgi:transposase InsO family protein